MTQTMSTLLYEVYRFAHPEEPKKVGATKDMVIRIVCDYLGTPFESLKTRSRKRPIVKSRQYICYLLRKFTSESLHVISTLFYQDHTTVIHNMRVIEDALQVDEDIRKEIELLEGKIRREQNIINHIKNRME